MESPVSMIEDVTGAVAAKSYSYSDLKLIANMSVEEFKSSDLYSSGFLGVNKLSEDQMQDLIDRAAEAVNTVKTQTATWNDITNRASSDYDAMYADSLSYLKKTSGIDDAQWDEAYNASVSDNYATGNVSFGGDKFENITVKTGDDNVPIDWSEMQYMKKTQLADGHFAVSDACYFDNDAKIGDTKIAAGGTITYLGTKNVSYDRDAEGFSFNPWDKDKGWAGTQNTTQMVHYEGYLGSFDYDASMWQLGYWQCKVGDHYVNVPVLHYNLAGEASNLLGNKLSGFTNGNAIQIPDGLKIADYMFAGTGIESMPELPEKLESAHCMFMNCTDLQNGCNDSKYESGNHQGTLKMPDSLKDVSWMFSGCSQMKDYFGEFGRNLLDGRYAFAECEALGWDGKTKTEDGKYMINSFGMPDLSKIRYGNSFWLQNMFDGCDDAVLKKINAYIDENGSLSSEWTSEDGVHYSNYDKLVDGSYNPELMQAIESESSRGQILQLIDKDGKGLTGVASDTANLASYGKQLTENGTLSDNSVWAKFRQSDFSETFDTGNEFGNILNHAIPAVGTYAVSKSLLNKMTNGKHKAISTIGAVALAAVPQVIGYGSTLTPMLDWTANAVGSDTKVGKFLTDLSNKLKGNVTYHTAVSELNVDETFESVQESAVKLAANQINSQLMTKVDYDGENVLLSSVCDISSDMRANGKNIARDANLLFIACEPEANLKNTLSDSIMTTSIEVLCDKMELELSSAGNDSDKIAAIRDKYSSNFMTLLYNLNEYDDSARDELESIYASDPELKAQAMNGLEKVMRCTAKPLYDHMAEIQSEFQEKYGIDFLSDKQLNDSEESTKTMSITGLGTFNDYDPNKDYSDQSDAYVEKLEVYQKALVEAVQNASSQEEIDAAYASYYETAYGWALDEAEAHGVILDKRGAQTTAEKDSFAEYIAKVESEQQAEFAAEDADGKTDDSETATQNNSTQSSDMTHQTGTAASGGSDLPETAEVMPDGIIFDAEYYAKMNPDVTQAVGNDFNRLFTHYVAFGVEEGRAAYEGDSGQTLPADYTEDIINEYKESFGSSCAEYAEEQAQKASERAAMVGVEDADTAEAEKAAISELNI